MKKLLGEAAAPTLRGFLGTLRMSRANYSNCDDEHLPRIPVRTWRRCAGNLVPVSLRVEAKAAELESTQDEVDRLRQELAPLRNIDAEYERAFMEKLGRVRQQEDETARRLVTLIAEVTQAASVVQEIDEAISAGAWQSATFTRRSRTSKRWSRRPPRS